MQNTWKVFGMIYSCYNWLELIYDLIQLSLSSETMAYASSIAWYTWQPWMNGTWSSWIPTNLDLHSSVHSASGSNLDRHASVHSASGWSFLTWSFSLQSDAILYCRGSLGLVAKRW